MNGADRLCDTLLANDIDVCFANPGTSEMHFVAALDRKLEMRCILGLFEGVATGAADGYARMADKPAAVLLHTGAGLANGVANLHNARRARSPVVNIVGDHATYHLKYDAVITSDIDGLARPVSAWVDKVPDANAMQRKTEEAILAARTKRGVATLILPADAAWGMLERSSPISPVSIPKPGAAPSSAVKEAAGLLRKGKRTAIILWGRALRADALEFAGRISVGTGADLISAGTDRIERGAGRIAARPIPYNIDLTLEFLKSYEAALCIGGGAPVAHFAYPGRPSTVLPHACECLQLGTQDDDLTATMAALEDELGLTGNSPVSRNQLRQADVIKATGPLNAETISIEIARLLPPDVIICDESLTSAGRLSALAPQLPPHDYLPLTGGAIGIGIPLAVGAAIACPDRKVLTLQADGSAMFTVQGLWTQARENLDVVTVIYSNRTYQILHREMDNVGVKSFGANARRMLDIENPEIDWCSLARGMGVGAACASTIEDFTDLFSSAMSRRGPFLIEARI